MTTKEQKQERKVAGKRWKAAYKHPQQYDAIVIARTGNMSHSDILRRKKRMLFRHWKKMSHGLGRRQRILLELKDTQMESTDHYTNEITKVLGNQAKIKVITHDITVEIRDLDEITVEE